MKNYLTTSAIALFLIAAPAAAFAQDSSGSNSGGAGASQGDNGNVGGGGNNNSETGGHANTGGNNNGGNNGGGSAGGSSDNGVNANGGNANTNDNTGSAKDTSQCSDETSSSSYGSFSSKCRDQIDAWAASQTGKSVTFSGDLAEGTVIPDSVEVMEVPAYRNYGYVMLNDKRVLVDRTTHKVVRVY
jgi:hypothetical protein